MIGVVAQLQAWAAGRSGKWPALRNRYIAAHPNCAACGGTSKLNVHHIEPFHIEPRLELCEENLITLCEKGPGSLNCHLCVGHGGNWKYWNPHVRGDAAFLRQMFSRVMRPVGAAPAPRHSVAQRVVGKVVEWFIGSRT